MTSFYIAELQLKVVDSERVDHLTSALVRVYVLNLINLVNRGIIVNF